MSDSDWVKRRELLKNYSFLDRSLKNVPISVLPILYIHFKEVEKDYKDKIKILKYNSTILNEVKYPQVPKSKDALELINKYGGLTYNFVRNQYRRSEKEVKEAKLKYKRTKSIYDDYIKYCNSLYINDNDS